MNNGPTYRNSSLTWQAHSVMSVNLEILRDGKWPNGTSITAADRQKIETENRNCEEILKTHNCEIPVLQQAAQAQLQLFI